jgi:hypothetical protein
MFLCDYSAIFIWSELSGKVTKERGDYPIDFCTVGFRMFLQHQALGKGELTL